MNHDTPLVVDGWGSAASRVDTGGHAARRLLYVVDAALCGVVFVAPLFFGGRHDLGRLVFVAFVAIAAAAWFTRQALLPTARWTHTAAHAILLLAVASLVVQLVPLPDSWLAALAPRTARLLPLWTAGGDPAFSLGQWRTLSLYPHETTKSLAMLVSYALLFIVVAQRIGDTADVRRLLRWIAASAVLMAGFGLLQKLTSNGLFFWFYEHPFRSTQERLAGSFTNPNHFAHFLVLGIGPLAGWFMLAIQASSGDRPRRRPAAAASDRLAAWILAGALALVVFAILWSKSRGGAAVMLVAASVIVAAYWQRRIVDARYFYGLAALAAAVVAVLSVLGNYDRVAARLDDFTAGSIDAMDQNQGRRKIWAANVAAIQDGWLAGAGAGTHREIYRTYMPDWVTTEYTHAESGYLQIATENGVAGLALALAAIGLCGRWSVVCLRHASTKTDVICFGAVAGGLAASVVHSVFEFVWFIPACMSLTVVLAACLLRLAQMARPQQVGQGRTSASRALPPARWWELTAAAVLVGGWAVYVFVGPASASIPWDRYLRASVANSELERQQRSDLVADRDAASFAPTESLSDTMIRQLELAVARDPQFARAHLQLADKYITRFELALPTAENAMTLVHVRDAVANGGFVSDEALQAWLRRALGENIAWLYRARAAARRAVELCPMQGEGYVFLAKLCFLEGDSPANAEAYIQQALRVRPHEADVLYAVGDQHLMRLNLAAAVEQWAKCFAHPCPHQTLIVYRLAGRISAAEFLNIFHPDWHTLRDVWVRYRALGQGSDLQALIVYADEMAQRQTQQDEGIRPEAIWVWLANMYTDLERSDDALTCLERAYAANPRQFFVRHALAVALLKTGRLAEAESHLRWCLARRPGNKSLRAALMSIPKRRLAEHAANDVATPLDGARK